MLNFEKFRELFGCYSDKMQDLILRQIHNPACDSVFGLDRLESNALRSYLGVEVKLDYPVVVSDVSTIPPMAKVSKKLMSGVMSQKYLLEIDEATEELAELIDITDVSQLNIVSKHTTGELMGKFGLAAYPLLRIAKENNIYPLPDLSPYGEIRPFVDIVDTNMSEHVINSLRRASAPSVGNVYSWCYGNVNCLLAMDDSDILKVRGIGKGRLEEIQKIKNIARTCYPEHYKRLAELKSCAGNGKYFKPGSRDEFEEFKKECELRGIISFDDEECLMRIEDYTPSELKAMFGEHFDVLEAKCASMGIYPLPEFDVYGNITRKYDISSVSNMGGYIFEKSARDIKCVHQLFELNDEELNEWLSGLSWMYKDTAREFVGRVQTRYPNHVAKLKEARAKRCCQKRISN